MVEQTYTLHYLGCSVLSKGTTGLGVIQKPLKELYFSFRKKQTKTPTEVYMQITREGLNMLTPDGSSQGHQLKSTLYKFQQVNYVEAVQFKSKNSSRKTQFAFMPLDDKRAVTSPEKLFSTLEKKNNYLLKMSHQPIVVCLIRRQAGVKALDCHVFISLSSTDAMKIVDSFAQMEQLSSQSEYKGDFRPVQPKSNAIPPANQWDGAYRSDYRSYPDHSYPTQGMADPNYSNDGRYQLRDEHFRGSAGQGKNMPLNEPPAPASYAGMHYNPPTSVASGGRPPPNYSPRGYSDIQERSRPISSYFGQHPPQQQPHHQPPISSSSSSHNLPINHSRGSSYEDRVRDYPPEPRYGYPRHEQPPMPRSHDDQLWNPSRLPPYEHQMNDQGRPLSLANAPHGYYNQPGNSNIGPMSRIDPRHALSTTDLPSQMSRNVGLAAGPYNHVPEVNHVPRREPRSSSPTHSGPRFSASNLESRQQLDESNSPGGSIEGHSKPVAKVPPHKIAGVKVLPSSFELPKRPTSPKPTYKSNDDDLYWEKQKVQYRNQISNNNNSPRNRYSSHYPTNNNYNDYHHQGASVINTKPMNYNQPPISDYYRNSSGLPINQSEIYSHYNNKYMQDYGVQNGNPVDRRYNGANFMGPSGMERRPHSYYEGELPKPNMEDKRKPESGNEEGVELMRKKEAELASMFKHIEIPSSNPRVPRYASQTDLNFEQSLGYYP